jgi:hypothetical protein
MTEKNKNGMRDTYEIDLASLFYKMIKVIKRYYLIFSFFLLAGFGYSIYQHLGSKDNYETRYSIEIQEDSRTYVENIISDLNQLIKKNKKAAAEKINLPPNIMGKVISIELDPGANKNVKSKFICKHKFLSEPKLIGDSIIQYINNIPFFKERVQQQRLQFLKQIEEIEQKMIETDSLQEIFMLSYLKNNKVIYINQNETQASLREEKFNLLEEKNEIENKLMNIDIVYMVDAITLETEVTTIKYFAQVLISIILALMVILFIELYRLGKKQQQ